MKHLLPTLLAALFFGSLSAQNLQLGWGYTNGSTGADGANDLAIDAAGNTYVTGYFSGTVDFDKGPGTANLSTPAGQTAKDAFVLKLNPQGNYVWAIRIGGIDNADQQGTKIALDTAGNVVVSGTFFGNVLLPPSSTNYNTSLTSPGSFMLKIDTAGTALWARAWCNTTSEMIIEDFVIDQYNRIVAVGEFTGTVNFSTNAMPNAKTSNGGKDFFVMQLGQNGNLQNVQSAGNVNDDFAAGIEVVTNQYWIIGRFKGTVDFNWSTGVMNKSSFGTISDCFILRLTSALNYSSVLTFSGTIGSLGRDIKCFNNLYVYTAGIIAGVGNLDPSSSGSFPINSSADLLFVQKFNLSGGLIWAGTFPSSSYSNVIEIEVNNLGQLLVFGEFSGNIDINPNPTQIQTLSTSGFSQFFLSQISSSGNFLGGIQIGGSSTAEYPTSLGIDQSNRVMLSGFYYSPFDIDPGPGTTTAYNAGQDDMVILKLISCKDTTVNTAKTVCGSYMLSNGQTITQSGTYVDTLQTAIGCDSVLNISLTVNLLPNTTVTQTGATFTAQPGLSYQWLNCQSNQPFAGETNQSFIATTNGQYAVIVSNGACTDTSLCIALTNIGVQEALLPTINLYPNPTTGLLNIQSAQPWQKAEVVDLLGRMVLTHAYNMAGQTTPTTELDLSKLPTGIYLVKVFFAEGVVVQRVIKE